MNILYLGDIMGQVGIDVVEEVLPKLKKDYQIDLVIAQTENLTNGKGISISDYQKIRGLGVDFCSGGNWTTFNKEIWPYLEDEHEPIIRPANYPSTTPGKGYKYITKDNKKILVISLLGHVVGKEAGKPVDNPLAIVDQILASATNKIDACIINFHGDYSSEKVIIGHYLDGKVTAVVGDHWHVPTADARVLPKGTAHVSDVGMIGVLDSSLGVTWDSVIPRWRDSKVTKNELETKGPRQFNAVLIKSNAKKLADSIEQIQLVIG